jgi:hypothetical protein
MSEDETEGRRKHDIANERPDPLVDHPTTECPEGDRAIVPVEKRRYGGGNGLSF